MADNYNFCLSGSVVLILHILIGIFLIYFGYVSLKNERLPDFVYIGVIVIGIVAILYNAHIMFTYNESYFLINKNNKF
jgi:hypothetical protein